MGNFIDDVMYGDPDLEGSDGRDLSYEEMEKESERIRKEQEERRKRMENIRGGRGRLRMH